MRQFYVIERRNGDISVYNTRTDHLVMETSRSEVLHFLRDNEPDHPWLKLWGSDIGGPA